MTLTMEQYQQKIKRWMKKSPKALKRALTQGATEIIAHAQRSRLSGPKMSRGVSGGFYRSTLKSQTNTLRRSLTKTIDVSSARVLAQIGTNIKYAAIHEYGGQTGRNRSVTMPERPYLRPSVMERQSRVLELIGDAFLGAYDDA